MYLCAPAFVTGGSIAIVPRFSAGAYFAYLAHPFGQRPAMRVARRLADEQNILALPGSMFGPAQDGFLRLAFANAEAASV